MSITTASLAGNVAAYSPVIISGTTSRTPFSSGVRISQTISSYADSGGLAQVAVSSSANFEQYDTVLISGATGDYIGYNGLHTVDAVISSNITLTTAYVSGATGTLGTIYKWNDSLRIKLVIKDDTSSVVMGTLYAYVDTTGAFSIDISRSLQSTFGSIFTQTTGDVTIGDLFSMDYEIDLYESFQKADYTTTEIQDASETKNTIAHRTTVYDADYVSGTSSLNTDTFAKGTALIHFQTDKTADVYITTTAYPGAIGVDHLIESGYTNGHCAAVVTIPATCDYVTISIGWDNGTQVDPIKDTFIIYNVKACNATVLYYLNRLGGYEGFAFTSYEDEQIVERVDKYKALTWQERTLQGREYPNAVYQSVRDLITSPEVYDESAVLVEVLTDSMTYRAESVNPVVVVKYEENHIQ